MIHIIIIYIHLLYPKKHTQHPHTLIIHICKYLTTTKNFFSLFKYQSTICLLLSYDYKHTYTEYNNFDFDWLIDFFFSLLNFFFIISFILNQFFFKKQKSSDSFFSLFHMIIHIIHTLIIRIKWIFVRFLQKKLLETYKSGLTLNFFLFGTIFCLSWTITKEKCDDCFLFCCWLIFQKLLFTYVNGI